MLSWNEYDFVECFGVLPQVGEDGISYVYTVEKDGLRLEVIIFQYDGDVNIDLSRDGIEPSIFWMRIKDCPVARYVKYENGMEYIEFAKGNSGEKYSAEAAMSEGVRIGVNPHIRIECFDER